MEVLLKEGRYKKIFNKLVFSCDFIIINSEETKMVVYGICTRDEILKEKFTIFTEGVDLEMEKMNFDELKLFFNSCRTEIKKNLEQAEYFSIEGDELFVESGN